jgi:hypothetical protein
VSGIEKGNEKNIRKIIKNQRCKSGGKGSECDVLNGILDKVRFSVTLNRRSTNVIGIKLFLISSGSIQNKILMSRYCVEPYYYSFCSTLTAICGRMQKKNTMVKDSKP